MSPLRLNQGRGASGDEPLRINRSYSCKGGWEHSKQTEHPHKKIMARVSESTSIFLWMNRRGRPEIYIGYKF